VTLCSLGFPWLPVSSMQRSGARMCLIWLLLGLYNPALLALRCLEHMPHTV
jgi:hypothetical protein